mmetsp:Transcript_4650/g.10939  ORF Transcript_4650/g.10939 Transcript_4650/m.10939 type:complete len:213 (+) Transcript_4650:539-1177(+)
MILHHPHQLLAGQPASLLRVILVEDGLQVRHLALGPAAVFFVDFAQVPRMTTAHAHERCLIQARFGELISLGANSRSQRQVLVHDAEAEVANSLGRPPLVQVVYLAVTGHSCPEGLLIALDVPLLQHADHFPELGLVERACVIDINLVQHALHHVEARCETQLPQSSRGLQGRQVTLFVLLLTAEGRIDLLQVHVAEALSFAEGQEKSPKRT